MIKGVSMGLGVVPADLNESSVLAIDKVRQFVRQSRVNEHLYPTVRRRMQSFVSASSVRSTTAFTRENTTVRPDKNNHRPSSTPLESDVA
jgi:hypothetical protein